MADIKTKRAPQVSIEGMERIIQHIYDDINEIIRALNSQSLETQEERGQTGDIKIVVTDVNTYELRAKTKDGWAKVDLSFVDKEN